MFEALSDLGAEVRAGLREFAVASDVCRDSNPPVFPIGGKGRARASFLRVFDFCPSGQHPFSVALRNFEDGRPDGLAKYDAALRAVGVDVRLRVSDLGGERCIIHELLLESKGDVHRQLELES